MQRRQSPEAFLHTRQDTGIGSSKSYLHASVLKHLWGPCMAVPCTPDPVVVNVTFLQPIINCWGELFPPLWQGNLLHAF